MQRAFVAFLLAHKMSEETEQSVCIKFCVKLGKIAMRTFDMLTTAFSKESMSRALVFK